MIGFIDSHLGLLVFTLLGAASLGLYLRGDAAGLFPFIAGALSTKAADGTSTPSVKNIGYFMGSSTVCWSCVKVTLAVCSAIYAGKLDPFGAFFVCIGTVATLTGAGYLVGKKISAGSFGADTGGPTP